jgi:hypothetical protein
MSDIYKITNSTNTYVEVYYSVFEYLSDGSTRGWVLNEVYRDGVVYRDIQDAPVSTANVICDPERGTSTLKDFVGLNFEFDPDYDEIERGVIRDEWLKGGVKTLNNSRWHVEESYIRFTSATIDLLDSDLNLIEKNIKMFNHEDA